MKRFSRTKNTFLKSSVIFLTGLISGIVLSAVLILFLFPTAMFTVSESKYDFDKTAEVLTESVKNNNWSLPHQYDLQQTMGKHGFDVKPVKIFSICKPDIAVRVLGKDDDRHISSMMPCRVAIYEKADGKTYIARMNAGLFSLLLGSNAKAVMGDAGSGSEKILEAVIKQ